MTDDDDNDKIKTIPAELAAKNNKENQDGD
jgi:hypothetical protein